MEPSLINPSRGRKEKSLPARGLLVLTPTDARHLPTLAEEQGLSQRFLYHSQLFAGPRHFLAGPAIGSPMAVLCLEKLIALGAKTILVYGWCGALRQHLRVGDLILPTWARCEEGTSGHYLPQERPASHVALRRHLAQQLAAFGENAETGPLWTTDAPYRETESKVSNYGEEGLLGVEMEYSALCTVASYRQVALAGLMLVSDELWRRPWKPGFTNPQFTRRSQDLGALLSRIVSDSSFSSA